MGVDPQPQHASEGKSMPEIVAGALAAAHPRPGLSWLDIGCGTGDLLRHVRADHHARRLVGLDLIDWLDDDLRQDVQLVLGPAETALEACEAADRVLLVETLEHLEAPWTTLRLAARRVTSEGSIVVTTPNVANLRHRLELPVRGQLQNFRPDNLPHMTPALPHVIIAVLNSEGFNCTVAYAGRDWVPLTGGRRWRRGPVRRLPQLTSLSVVIGGRRAISLPA